jgi:alpha-1,2-rhamnosyltransferase
LVYAYKNSKALVFASKIEGFGLPIVESLHFGLPVLVSDIPVHREIGKDQVTYFSLENVDNLVNKIKNEELKNIKNYQWLNWYESTKMLIEKAIKIVNDS